MVQITITKRVAAIIAIAAVLVIPGVAGANHIFTDVVDSNVHAPGIEWVANVGVTAGCGDGSTYCPNDPVTRAQMATFMHRLSGESAVTPSVNADKVDGFHANEIGLISLTTVSADCPSSTSFDSTYDKIGDVGTFTKQQADSRVVISFNGRIYAASVTGSGAVFELRVNNVPTADGFIRSTLKSSETGGGAGVQVAMKGTFNNLAPGDHTVSMWVRTGSGTGTTGMWNPGCWSDSDHLVIEEYGSAA